MRVHNDSYRSVVDECHLHVGAEDTSLHLFADNIRQQAAEFFIHRNGEIGPRSMYIAGSVPLARTCHKGELADDEDAEIFDSSYREIHHALFVVENPHLRNLVAQVVDVLFGVAVLDAYKHQQAVTYLAVPLTFDVDRSRLNSLYYCSHSFL